jgi:cell division protein FtsW
VIAAAPRRSGPDIVLVGCVASLVAFGLVMIFSASSATAVAMHQDAAYYLKRQILWVFVASLAAYIAYRCDYRKLRAVAPFALIFSVVTLVLVLVPHIGLSAGHSHRWLGRGSFAFEPSEFSKLSLVIYLAAALASKGERVRSLTEGIFPLGVACGILGVLVLMEPDLGTASLLAFTTGAMLFAAGARIVHLVMVAGVTIPPVALLIMHDATRRDRLLAFLDPWKDPLDKGYHIIESLYALGNGGATGLGLGFSREKFFWLPEQFTDFIASIIGEELGFAGILVLIVLFVVIAFRAARIALRAPDRFGFFLAVGCMSLVVVQAFVNLGVVSSVWPVTGVPLPFVSFGGSSLVVSLVAVALIVNVGRTDRARDTAFDRPAGRR